MYHILSCCFDILDAIHGENTDNPNKTFRPEQNLEGLMSSADYKKPRKSEFPQCAKDALIRIGTYVKF